MSIHMDKKLGFGAMRLPLRDPEDQKSIDLGVVCRMVLEDFAALYEG